MCTDLANYPILDSYTVLSAASMTTEFPIRISHGQHGCAWNSTSAAMFTGTENNTDVGAALEELTEFESAICSYGINKMLRENPTEITLTPGSYFGDGINFHRTVITLDGTGYENAQFCIQSSEGINFTNVRSIHLIGNATQGNVFWVADTNIKFTGRSPPYVPGVFIASSVTFENAVDVDGRIYARCNNVSFGRQSHRNDEAGVMVNGCLVPNVDGVALPPLKRPHARCFQ